MFASYFLLKAVYAITAPYLQIILRNQGFSHANIGVLLAIYEAASIVGPVVIGALADKKKRYKAWALVSLIICSIAFIPMSLSSSAVVVAFALMVASFFFRSVSPLQDTVTTIITGGDDEKFSRLNATGSLGFVVMCLFYAYTSFLDTASNISILSWLLGSAVLYIIAISLWKSDKKRNEEVGVNHSNVRNQPPARCNGTWFDSGFVIALIIMGCFGLAMSASNSFLSLYMTEVLHWQNVSLMNALSAGSEFFMMIFAGYLMQKKKVQPMYLILSACIAVAVRLCIYALVPTVAGLVAGQLLHAFCYGAYHPAAVILLTRRAASDHRALAIGMYTSLGTAVPAMIGSALGGVILECFGFTWLFYGYSIFGVLSAILCIVSRKTLSQKPFDVLYQ